MNRRVSTPIALLAAIGLSGACDSGPEPSATTTPAPAADGEGSPDANDPKPADAAEPAKPIAVSTAAPGEPPEGGGDAPDAEGDAEAGESHEVDPAVLEKDPNATAAVTPYDTKNKLPDGVPVVGEFQDAIGWTDKYGKHAVVFGRKETAKGEESVTSLLVADFVTWEGDAWTSQRKFRERVPECMFDTELYEIVGDWSVTDLDQDGIGEATFAWRAGCRSDVSPVTHKVLVVEHQGTEVSKFVLRGDSAISVAGQVDAGGTYKADKAFDAGPPAFLEHAKKVWSKTSVEKF